MIRHLPILFFLLPLGLSAQHAATAERILADRLPERFFIDIAPLRSEILARVPRSPEVSGAAMEKRTARRNMRFADQQAFGISELLSSGYVYSDWDELEVLINAVMQKVVPADLKDGDKVHAYLVRDADFNASMSSTGYMFVNIGLLSEVYDEASLAAVMCHELAHYHLDHGFYKFQARDIGDYSGDNGERRASEESVRMELQADSLAMIWMLASDYDLHGMYEMLSVIDRLEKQVARLEGVDKSAYRPTHPGATERLAAFGAFYAQHKQDKGANFLVDEAAFTRLRAACRPELLRVQLQGMDYSACIRAAFNYHIFDPDEPLYVWYLMEAMRRACYLDADMWDKHFIMDDFTPQWPQPGNALVEKHLFEAFDTDVMCIAPQMFRNIQARFYWDGDLKFITYREAYLFFSKLGELLGCNECRLSAALNHYDEPTIRDSLLTVYVAGEARHKDFARDILEKKLRSGFGPGKLLVFSGIDAYVRQGRDEVPVRVGDDTDGVQFARLADSLAVVLPGRHIVSLPVEKRVSLDRYLKLVELRRFAAFPTVAKGERTELHVLDPRYYELFKAEQVDEIEFVYCHYGELRGQERTAEAYEETATTDHKTIFDQTTGSRYLDVYVSSLREIPKSPMKMRYYGDEYIMKSKRTGFQEIVMEIKRVVARKEEKVRQILIYDYK